MVGRGAGLSRQLLRRSGLDPCARQPATPWCGAGRARSDRGGLPDARRGREPLSRHTGRGQRAAGDGRAALQLTPAEDIRAAFRSALDASGLLSSDKRVLVACSGGGDSIALLYLTVGALGPARIACATVNHNLRQGAAAEVALVARHCAAADVPHAILDWHWDGQGNLQAAARDARRRLLADHVTGIGAGAILLGHTADDQAETVLMRLARGSGIDGLAGMAARDGIWIRPLLGVPREPLRDWLRAEGIDWAEDPSNEDPRFDRVRVRQLMPALEGIGITRDRLIRTAAMMAEERVAANRAASDWAARFALVEGGDLLFDREAFEAGPPALRHRLLAAVIRWFSGAPYRPRLADLEAWEASGWQTARTLGGVVAAAESDRLRFMREAAATADPVALADGVPITWDNRWTLEGPAAPDLTVGALGPVLDACPDWRATGLSRRSLETTPAVRDAGGVIAAPLAGFGSEWTATLRPTFTQFLVSH
ncbi:tRNA lysidine(34) synthetase TilS [Rhodobacterales bacterium HKCCE3408]|nr:tRNA lysidine(34) synthetase TilS [Rhodobacterales bacterium HKCCE3408]